MYGKKPKKEEKNAGFELLTEIFHGLGEESFESVQTVALGVHPLQTILMSRKRFDRIVEGL